MFFDGFRPEVALAICQELHLREDRIPLLSIAIFKSIREKKSAGTDCFRPPSPKSLLRPNRRPAGRRLILKYGPALLVLSLAQIGDAARVEAGACASSGVDTYTC